MGTFKTSKHIIFDLLNNRTTQRSLLHMAITKLKEPVIELVKADELTGYDLSVLNFYKTDRSEFVISHRGVDNIIINADHEKAAELKELTRKIMNYRGSESRSKALKRFRELTSTKFKADIILLHVRYFWIKACHERELREQAEDFFRQAEKKGYLEKAKEEELIKMLHSVGFGMDISPKDAMTALDEEKQLCFIYGYMMGLKAAGQTS